jgi:outer membrane protein TolC
MLASDQLDLKHKLKQRIEELKSLRNQSGVKSRLELLDKRKQKKAQRQKLLLKQKENRKMELDTKVLFVLMRE